jgi:hypothetical protein
MESDYPLFTDRFLVNVLPAAGAELLTAVILFLIEMLFLWQGKSTNGYHPTRGGAASNHT